MITYTYKCKEQQCQHQFEAQQKISDPPLSYCPACDKESVERIVVSSNFSLKGKGWFKDGY